MTNKSHLDILAQGIEIWNTWRVQHPDVQPQLSGVDLSDMDLATANLSEANLSGAALFEANLREANLKAAVIAEADLSGADLSGAELYKADLANAYLTGANLTETFLAEAELSGADLRGARFRQADLTETNLVAADLRDADLTGANLSKALIADAILCNAKLTSANLTDLEYGPFHTMRGHYYGIRGLDSCYGNALFIRDARDQDYLDTLERNIEKTPSRTHRRLRRFLFRAWAWIDYGRSLGKPFFYSFVIAMIFGIVFFLERSLNWGLMDYSSSSNSLISPFYYSIVTYTTLGFGDITPRHWIGEIIVTAEVVLGYTTLGLLLAILANRVARRS
ncbi:MAG: pentapeptide repeat-containing protein [Chloroflexota bacterium]|nr:MAG: pentapeptide repeat-containing protein [Chloroflexota bacterium]